MAREAAGSFTEELVDSLRIKPDQDLFSDDERRRSPAVVGANQFEDRFLVGTDVFLDVLDSSLREDDLNDLARRSAGLREEYHLFRLGHALPGGWDNAILILGRSGRMQKVRGFGRERQSREPYFFIVRMYFTSASIFCLPRMSP